MGSLYANIVVPEGVDAGIKSALQRWVAAEREEPFAGDLARAYATAVTLYAMANFRADNVAEIPLRVRAPGGDELPAEDARARLFTRRFRRTMRRTELTMAFWGKNLLVKERNFYGDWVGLRWLNPHLWAADTAGMEGLRGFFVYPGGGQYEREPSAYLRPEDVVYTTEVDFEDDFDGVAPAEVAFSFAGVEEEAAQTMLHFFRNRAIPALLLQPARDEAAHAPDKNAALAVRDFFRRMVQGSRNTGRTIIDWHRWEAVSLQGDFDKAAAPTSVGEAREAVSLAMRVPLSLLISAEENYASAYDKRLGWKESWLMPRCRAYADYFSESAEAEFGPGWSVEPDFADIMHDLAAKQTEIVNAQVAGTLLTLYEAQRRVGVEEPDERLKDLYVVRGLPVPGDQLRTLWERERPAFTYAEGTDEGEAEGAGAIPGAHDSPLPPRPESPASKARANIRGPAARVDYAPVAAGFWVPLDGAAEQRALEGLRELAARLSWNGLEVEWVPPAEWHLSLCYTTDEVAPADLAALLTSNFGAMARFAVEARAFAVWDTADGPCLVVLVEADENLRRLQALAHAQLVARGLAVSEYGLPANYTPHVTLAYGGPAERALPRFTPVSLAVAAVELVAEKPLFRWVLGSEAGAPAASPARANGAGAEPAGPALAVDARALDAAMVEFSSWMRAGTKGRAGGFQARAIPPDSAAYTRLLLSTDEGDAFLLGKKHYVEHHSLAVKGYSETAVRYRAALYDLIRSAFQVGAEGQPAVDRRAFGDLGRAEIATAFRAAFRDGLRAGGVETETLEAEEEAELAAEIKAERGYWTALANALYRQALPLRARAMQEMLIARAQRDPEERDRLLRRADELYAEFRRARDDFIARIDLWVNKGLARMFDAGRLYAAGNGMMRWVLGATEKHCATCLAANGQVHRAKSWRRAGVRPKTDALICGGFNCDCDLVPAPGAKAQGRLDQIPLKNTKARKHEGTKGEEEQA